MVYWHYFRGLCPRTPGGLSLLFQKGNEKSDTVCRLSEPDAVLGSLPSFALSPAKGKCLHYNTASRKSNHFRSELRKIKFCGDFLPTVIGESLPPQNGESLPTNIGWNLGSSSTIRQLALDFLVGINEEEPVGIQRSAQYIIGER